MFIKYEVEYYDDYECESTKKSGICFGENTTDCVKKIMEYYGETAVDKLVISYSEMYDSDVIEEKDLEEIGL